MSSHFFFFSEKIQLSGINKVTHSYVHFWQCYKKFKVDKFYLKIKIELISTCRVSNSRALLIVDLSHLLVLFFVKYFIYCSYRKSCQRVFLVLSWKCIAKCIENRARIYCAVRKSTVDTYA